MPIPWPPMAEPSTVADHYLVLREPFREAAQQREADGLGMWVFLGTEAMMFGGLFFALIVIRVIHPAGAQQATNELDMWLGGLNSALLLTSSLTTTLAVNAVRRGARRAVIGWMLCSATLGTAFLGIKGYEYYVDYTKGLMPGVGKPFPLDAPGAELFINGYFASTGLHAVHLGIGILVVLGLAMRLLLRRLAVPERGIVVEMTARYWHFVDLVWIFLYPILYLMGRGA
jgi:cytochrome c oxidase subunit 3